MIYHFKFRPEVVRAVGLALGTFLLEALSDPRLATDPRGWAIAAGIGGLHVAVVAIMGLYSTPAGQQAQTPAMPVAPPTAPPSGFQGAPQFGTTDVRVGQSGPAVAPYRPAPPQPPLPTAAELLHQRRSESARKGWATRRTPPGTPPPG